LLEPGIYGNSRTGSAKQGLPINLVPHSILHHLLWSFASLAQDCGEKAVEAHERLGLGREVELRVFVEPTSQFGSSLSLTPSRNF
jgi:hypothetical protein